MVKISDLSPAARSAAMRGGTKRWGAYGNQDLHVRYMQPIWSTSRRRCPCCKRRATHAGMTNGVCLRTGCELSIRRWVKGEKK